LGPDCGRLGGGWTLIPIDRYNSDCRQARLTLIQRTDSVNNLLNQRLGSVNDPQGSAGDFASFAPPWAKRGSSSGSLFSGPYGPVWWIAAWRRRLFYFGILNTGRKDGKF